MSGFPERMAGRLLIRAVLTGKPVVEKGAYFRPKLDVTDKIK
jgi:hypothetical protein